MKKRINGKRNIWKETRTTLVIVTIVISFAAIASAAPSGTKFPDSTPLQNNIKQAMANGVFSANDIEGSPEYSIQVLEKNESHIEHFSGVWKVDL